MTVKIVVGVDGGGTGDRALDYAKEHGIDAIVQEPKSRRASIRPGGYGENFATNRRGAWTH